MQHQTVILVNSLDLCRYFYREHLKLGEPVCDSSDVAVFQLDENSSLVLEACQAKYLEHASSAVSWSIGVKDFDGISADLEEHGFTVGGEFIRFGSRSRRVHDPESNCFYITEES